MCYSCMGYVIIFTDAMLVTVRELLFFVLLLMLLVLLYFIDIIPYILCSYGFYSWGYLLFCHCLLHGYYPVLLCITILRTTLHHTT